MEVDIKFDFVTGYHADRTIEFLIRYLIRHSSLYFLAFIMFAIFFPILI